MKKVLIGLCLVCLAVPLNAEEAKWKIKGLLGATLNSTNVTENWSGEEKNSQSWTAKLDASAERDSGINNWISTLKEEYGRTKIDTADETANADLLELSSVYTRKLSIYVNPYVAVFATTQNWELLAPVSYTESIGNGVWILNRPAQQLKTRAGLAFRQKYDKVHTKTDAVTGLPVQYSAADNGDTPEIETSMSETGGEWVTNYDLLIMADTKFSSEARVFTAFNGGASLRWDNTLFLKASSLVTVALNYLIIYNFDKKPRPVWPQDSEKRLTLTIGLSYNLF